MNSANNTVPASIKINGRDFAVSTLDTGANAAADLKSCGFDETFYALTGTRGACYMAIRSIKTGAFTVTAKV